MKAAANGGGPAIEAHAGTGLDGKIFGNVDVTGTLTKGSGSFKIDHPLDPANKYLSHSFVESPGMRKISDNFFKDRRRAARVDGQLVG